jgi:hypothetical protein
MQFYNFHELVESPGNLAGGIFGRSCCLSDCVLYVYLDLSDPYILVKRKGKARQDP